MQLFIQSGDLGPKWFHVAIRAMVLMADSEVLLKSNHIAELLGEDPTTIRKILSKLTKANLVLAHGGRYGGYCLAKDSSEITVGIVYNAFEPPQVPYWTVPSTGSELYISLIISKAEEQFQASLDNYSIKEILKYKSQSKDNPSTN
jgi:Rrf2 family protein